MSNKILMPQLISLLAASSGKTRTNAEIFIKAFFNVIAQTLASHESVKIKGFGTFKINRVEARKSVNVSTGAEMQIPAHYKVVFTPSKSMAEKVNRDFSWLEIVEISDNVSNEELESFDSKPALMEGTRAWAQNSVDVEQPPVQEFPVPEPQPAPENDEEDVIEEITPDPIEETPPRIVIVAAKAASEARDMESDTRTVTENTPPITYVSSPVAVTEQQEERSEQLGEELEKDFGDIEPVEPFGPVDPMDPEPGQPIPENSVTEFDPYTADQPIEKPQPQPIGFSREEYDNLLKKSDLKPIGRHIKKIRLNVERVEKEGKKRSRNYFIWSVVISLALITGACFLVYGILNHSFWKEESELAEAKKVAPVKSNEEIDDEEITVDVKNTAALSTVIPETSQNDDAQQQNAQTQSQPAKEVTAADAVAPTAPSDSKKFDKVTKTRYLTTMAKEYYGNYNLWPYIYLENEAKLGHPDRIKPGTTIVIPNIEKYGVNPSNPKDIEKAKKLGVEIYKKFNK